MTLAQTDEQRELADAVRKLLAEQADALPPAWEATGTGLNRSLWESLAQLGLLGVGVAEGQGGSGGELRDLCIVAEQVGVACARIPFSGTASVLAAGVLKAGPIVDGSLVAVPAWETFPAIPARRSSGLKLSDFAVEGSLQAVAFGMDADVLLAFSGNSTILVNLDQPGVRRKPVAAFDVTEPTAAVVLSGAEATIVDPGPFLARALTVVAAELIGTGQRALDGAVDYAKQRHQFGRPIGSFQALKHMLADRHVQLDAARLVVDAAITASEERRLDELTGAWTALVAASDAAQAATADALQAHGGIGFTWEHPSHVFLKRVRARRCLFGSSAQQLDALGALLLESHT